MKPMEFLSTATLALLLGIGTSSSYAQDRHEQGGDHEQQGKPAQGDQDRVSKPQRQDKRIQQEDLPSGQVNSELPQPQRAQQQLVPGQRGSEPSARHSEGRRIQQAAWRQHRARSWRAEHRTWQQRGGYDGYRIPDDHFRGDFGPTHGFHIYGLPYLVTNGYPRFQYRGYWFSPVDPWPEYWASNWYDTDNVYINYVDNGYYLYDRRYPRVAIAITVSL